MNKKTRVSRVGVLVMGLIMVMMLVLGIFMGMEIGEQKLIYNVARALQYTDIDITFDFNETRLVEEMNKTIIPQLLEYARETS